MTYENNDKVRLKEDVPYPHMGFPSGSTVCILGKTEKLVAKKGQHGVVFQTTFRAVLFQFDPTGNCLENRYFWVNPDLIEPMRK